jgi:low affinity Fe/Cu permease
MIAKKKTAKKKKGKSYFEFDTMSKKATTWIGSNQSIAVHSTVFIFTFLLPIFGVPWDTVLLVLTTIVSLEAIYLAIFIQMTVNKNTADIEEIQEDVDEIQEDVEEIQEDVEGIEKDVDEIQKDVDEIQEDVEEIQEDVEEDEAAEIKRDQDLVQKIEGTLAQLLREIEELKNKQK